MPTEATRNRLAALTSVAGVAASVAVGLVSLEYRHIVNDLDELRRTVSDLRAESAENRTHRIEHEKTAAYWIGQIGTAHRRLADMEIQVAGIRTGDDAAADRFTGKDGEALTAIVDANRYRITRLEQCCDHRMGP